MVDLAVGAAVRCVVALQRLTPPPMPSLPSGPILDRWILESPWPFAGLVALAGAAAWVWGARRGRRRAGAIAAAVCGAIAAGALIAGASVQTDRERIVERSRAVIAAVAAADVASLEPLLDERVRLFRSGAAPMGAVRVPAAGMERDDILGTVALVVPRYGIASYRIRRVEGTLDGPGVGRTQVLVVVTSVDRLSHQSWWRLDWQRSASGTWRVSAIEPLWLQGVD